MATFATDGSLQVCKYRWNQTPFHATPHNCQTLFQGAPTSAETSKSKPGLLTKGTPNCHIRALITLSAIIITSIITSKQSSTALV